MLAPLLHKVTAQSMDETIPSQQPHLQGPQIANEEPMQFFFVIFKHTSNKHQDALAIWVPHLQHCNIKSK